MAGSLRDGLETAFLQHIFENADVAGIGDGTGLRGSSTAGNLYIALYTVAPTDSTAGTECAYTGYARKAITREDASWTTASGATENTAAITFDPCTGGSETAVAFAICKAGTKDVDDQIFWGDLSAGLAISSGITPEFAAGELDVSLD